MSAPDVFGKAFAIFEPAMTKAYRARGCGTLAIVTRYADGDLHFRGRHTVHSWADTEAIAKREGAELELPPGFKWRSGNRNWSWRAVRAAG